MFFCSFYSDISQLYLLLLQSEGTRLPSFLPAPLLLLPVHSNSWTYSAKKKCSTALICLLMNLGRILQIKMHWILGRCIYNILPFVISLLRFGITVHSPHKVLLRRQHFWSVLFKMHTKTGGVSYIKSAFWRD